MRLTASAGLLALLLLTAPMHAAPAPAEAEPEGAAVCLDRPLPSRSAEQVISIRTREADQLETTLSARIYWKRLEDGRHGALLRLTAPEEVARMSVLVREEAAGALAERGPRGGEIYLYLPEFQRVRRVSPRQATTSLFGTAFSYEDLDRLQGQIRSSRVEELGEATLGGRPAYVLEVKPGQDVEPSYTRIRSSIDVETCLPLQIEYFDVNNELSKKLEVDPAGFEQVDGIWIARRVVMTDLHDGVQSELSIESIHFDQGVPDRYFVPASLAEDF